MAGSQDCHKENASFVLEARRCKSVPRSQFSRTQKPFGCTSGGHSGRPNTDAPIAFDQKLVLVEWRAQRQTGRTTVVCFGRMTRQVTSGRNKRGVSSIQSRTLCRLVAKLASHPSPFVHTRASEVRGVQVQRILGGIFSTAPFISGFDILKHWLCAQNGPELLLPYLLSQFYSYEAQTEERVWYGQYKGPLVF